MAIDATVGTLTSETYADETFADAFFLTEAHPSDNTLWTALSTANKEIYLRRARSQMDISYNWIGIRTTGGNGQDEGQALEWPRTYVPRDGWSAEDRQNPPFVTASAYEDNPLISPSGIVFLKTDTIPDEIKKGQCQLALDFSVSDRAADSSLNQLKSLSADGNRIEWRSTVPNSEGTISSKANDYLRRFGILKKGLNSESRSMASTRMMVRG